MQSSGVKVKELLTILGIVVYKRSAFKCPNCGNIRYPGDEELDVLNTTRSPGLRRMMARAGSKSTFKEGRDDLAIYADIHVSAKGVERVAESIGADMLLWSEQECKSVNCNETSTMAEGETIPVLYISYDGTGVPMTKQEVAGRKGKQEDGTARTREVKLGCVFTQTVTDDKGFPMRDPESTSFVGKIETAGEFGDRIYNEALRRGLENAERVVVLGDGAPWIWNLADEHFWEATQILDLFHVRQHVSDLCKLLFSPDEKEILRYRTKWWTDLDEGKVEKIAAEARSNLPMKLDLRDAANREIRYLEKNKERLRYADFRAQGLFVGSGVIEAGCKNVIGKRLKQSGMEWSVRGADSIIALRCVMISGRLEDYWESRVA